MKLKIICTQNFINRDEMSSKTKWLHIGYVLTFVVSVFVIQMKWYRRYNVCKPDLQMLMTLLRQLKVTLKLFALFSGSLTYSDLFKRHSDSIEKMNINPSPYKCR